MFVFQGFDHRFLHSHYIPAYTIFSKRLTLYIVYCVPWVRCVYCVAIGKQYTALNTPLFINSMNFIPLYTGRIGGLEARKLRSLEAAHRLQLTAPLQPLNPQTLQPLYAGTLGCLEARRLLIAYRLQLTAPLQPFDPQILGPFHQNITQPYILLIHLGNIHVKIDTPESMPFKNVSEVKILPEIELPPIRIR